MNSLLPNLRFLTLPSSDLGGDWFEKSQKIDSVLDAFGLDLAQEEVYLLFSHSPSDVLEGEGKCLVARPVIGPKKELEKPFELTDWKASPVLRLQLEGESLVELLESAEESLSKLQNHHQYASDFILCAKRELKPALILSVEAIFHE